MENIIPIALLFMPSLVVLVIAGYVAIKYIKEKEYLLATISFGIALCIIPIIFLATGSIIHILQ